MLVRIISDSGHTSDSHIGRSRMWPPSPSDAIACPTPVLERSSVRSEVFDAMSVPIIAHATRPMKPSMHESERSTRHLLLSAALPASSFSASFSSAAPAPSAAALASLASLASLAALAAFSFCSLAAAFSFCSLAAASPSLLLRFLRWSASLSADAPVSRCDP